MNRLGRIVILLFLSLALLAGISSFWAPRYFEAAWFLEDIAAGEAPSSWKKLHKAPAISTVDWTVENRYGSGDLYTPDGPITGRMIFVPGLVADARTDPRVIAFANTLARAGFLTLVPQTAAFDQFRANTGDIATISDATIWLEAADIPNAPKTKVGLSALSYMSGPVMLAAARQPAADKVGFVFFIGGYYSATDVIRFVTTRKYRLDASAPWSEAPAAPYALWAFLRANAQSLESPDRETLTKIADIKVDDESADIASLAAALSPDGKAVLNLVMNRDPDRVDALVAALPAILRSQIEALDPSRQDLSGFRGEAILVHGTDDPMIPPIESQKLAEALGSRAHLYILDQVTHVEMNRPSGLWDQLDLLFAARRLLSQRE
jgi:pimeloyl-ACP methyl ester carboxylesterase